MENVLLSDELKMMRNVVKKFIEKEVVKAELEEGALMQVLPEEKVRHLQKKAKEIGLWELGINEEWGGTGLNLFSRVVLMEEAAQHRLGFLNPAAGAFGKDIPSFLTNYSNGKIDDFVHKAIESGKGCYMAITEDQGGSEITNIQTTAKNYGSTWFINGKKRYIFNAQEGDFGILLVNCIKDGVEKGPTLFLIPQNKLIQRKKVQLIKSIETYDLEFEQFELSDEYRIGEIGEGLSLINQWMKEQQVLTSARCIGVAKKALELAVEWASSRETFGKKLKDRQAIQWMIADSEIGLNSARYMLWSAAITVDEGITYSDHYVEMAKLLCTETAFQIVDRCIQIHGGMGVAQEMPLERWYREIRTSRLDLGNSEVLRANIAKRIFDRIENGVS